MIVITTPTGSIGSKVLHGVLAAGATEVRLIARDKKRLPSDLPAFVDVVQGQTDAPAVLRKALQGASALFWCQPDTPTAPDYYQAYADWSRVARDAISASGVPRVVAISGAGEKPTVPAGPATGLHMMEEIFSETPAALRFLRCGNFFSNLNWSWESILKDGVFSSGLPGDAPAPYVAVEDIARVAVGYLVANDWTGREALQLLGPEDLKYNDMAAEISRKLGKPVRYEQLSPEANLAASLQAGMSLSAAQGLLDIHEYLLTHYQVDPLVDRSITPTTFKQWLQAQ